MEPVNKKSNFAQSVWTMDKDHVVHPWTHFDSFRETGALVIEKGDGPHIWDVEGKKYFDAVGGLWSNNIGLGREEMAQAISEQVTRLAFSNTFVDMANVPASELSEKLASLAPEPINHVFFTTGGSTAVDTAYRIMHFYQNCRNKPTKKHVIARHEGYHGSTFAAASIGGKAGDHIDEMDFISDTIHHVTSPNLYREGNGRSEEAFCDDLVNEIEAKIMEIGPDNVGAFFAEPIQGAGGVVVPPKGYFKRAWELCQKHDILFIADEVVTGFGRLGHWFASEDVFGVTPDMITCAKGLTSGYLPLGATLINDKIFDTISQDDPDRYFPHGFTYGAHPVCCAAALKNIEIMERENLLNNVQELAPYFQSEMKKLEELPIVGEVRGEGFMVCVENVMNKETKELFPDELNIGKWVSDSAEKQGLIVRPIAHLNVMSPALNITKDDIDLIVSSLKKAIEQTYADLKAEGHL